MRRALPLLAAACGLLIAGCEEGSTRPACPKGELCLEFGNTGDLLSLDPYKGGTTSESQAVGEFFTPLLESAPDGQPVPGVATKWETSPDGLTWTFHLRDMVWSDGVPVTADDFVYGLRRLFDPKTASDQASQLYPIKDAKPVNEGKMPLTAVGAAAPDPHTLVVTLEHPWPILPYYANSLLMSPTPKHAVEKYGDAWVQPQNYVGNGPYLPVSSKLGDKVVARKNPRYFDAAKICFDEIRFYPTIDAISAERRVKRGELDVNTRIQSNRVEYLRKPGQMPDYVRVHPWVGVTYLAYNMRDVPALKDVRVRRALSMAIDRDFITKKLLRGEQQPAYGFVPPGMVDYSNGPRVDWADWPFEKRQAEARRLLAEAGYGPRNPLKIDIKHRNTSDPSLVMPAIQADWKAIGVIATLSPNESQIAYESYRNRDFQVADAGWVGGNNAMDYLYMQRADVGTQNYGGYDNPAYDAVLDQADQERDLGKREAILKQAERIILADAPVSSTFFMVNLNLVSPRIVGWVDNSLDAHRIRFMCFKDAAARVAALPKQ
jgi:oligopeptide transport system substrate-binding protein